MFEFATIVMSAFGVMFIVLLLGAAHLRWRRMRNDRIDRISTEEWKLSLDGGSGVGAAAALDEDQWLRFARNWNESFRTGRDATRRTLEDLARDVGFDRVALKWVERGPLRARLLGVLSLGNLRLVEGRATLVTLLEHDHPYLSLSAAQALVRIDASELQRVLPIAAHRDDWPKSRVLELLKELGAAATTGPVVSLLQSDEPGVTHRAVAWLGVIEPGTLRNEVARLLRSDDPELVAAACRHAADSSHLSVLRKLLASETWFVRLQAAVALSRFATAADIELLTPMLDDPQWWVRYRLAQALCAIPNIGDRELERIRTGAGNAEAREMLSHLIAVRSVT